ncbi:MAG: 3-isopropylmalate dehydratase small subunit [Proteobacteria bacterium]|nr:3-isopropylmalate dehydratase small subunit [Pseudomonadota bacterium]
MAQFKTLTARAVVLPIDNIDTDQIIPARFLKVTDKDGLGEALFCDWRKEPSFVLNQPAAAGAQVLVTGDNFGCGSSREHAPWALIAAGFRAVVSTSFADIFRNNALKNGLLPVAVTPALHGQLVALLQAQPDLALTIDLEAQHLRWPGGPATEFPIDRFARDCLLRGIDQLDYLLGHAEQIAAFEAQQQS